MLGTCAHVRAHNMHTLYRARCMTFAKYKRCYNLCTIEPESWVKPLIRIRERIEIVYITIVFLSVLIGFVITVILAHVTWVLAREWALSIRTAKTVTWALTRDTMVTQLKIIIIFIESLTNCNTFVSIAACGAFI